MNIFRWLTPVSYWMPIIMWASILIFCVCKLRSPKLKNKLIIILIIILSIDAFRALFESVYFGFWYTSLSGLTPSWIHDFLVRPFDMFIPKFINVVTAILVILILIRKWIPAEEEEREKQEMHTGELEKEINERKAAEMEIEKLIAKLEVMTFKDPLTNLNNRRGFQILAQSMLTLSRRTGQGLALLYIGMDNFKWINDTMGHGTGDEVLISFGNILQNTFRASDIIARLGGDEFLVLLTETSQADLEAYMIRLKHKIQEFSKKYFEDFDIGISIGFVRFDPERHFEVEELISEADNLMYEEKKFKKNLKDILKY